MIVQWAGMEITTSKVSGEALKKRETHIIISQDVDVLVRNPKSFVLCNDAISTL